MNTVITGASRGIGLELVKQALSKKHKVLAVARSPERSPELMALKSKFPLLEVVAADVASADAGTKMANALEAWPCVDILINNAGVYETDDTADQFLKSFQTNTIAPFFIARALFSKLKLASKPKLINITSLMGSIEDNQSGGSYAYRASKAALNMVTKTLAQDERWLCAAVIHPGWVLTDMGGANAPTTINESVTGIWSVIEGLRPQDTGCFFDYEGDRLPW